MIENENFNTMAFSILLNFIYNENIIIQNCNFISNNFQNVALIQSNHSSLFITNSLFESNNFNDKNAILMNNSTFTFQNNSIKNNFFFENMISYISCPDCQILDLLFSNCTFLTNNGTSLISINFKSIQNQNTNLIFKDLYFFSQNFLNYLILCSNINNFNISKVVFRQCITHNVLDLFNINNFFNEQSYCLNNIGTCLFLNIFVQFNIVNSKIINCTSELYTPGLIIQNIDKLNGYVYISNVIFVNNNFNSDSSEVQYLGCSLFITNVFFVSINSSYFKNNSAFLTSNSYAGPSLVYFNDKGSVLIINSSFQDNKVLENSLSFEFQGVNLTIIGSNFINNIQLYYSSAFTVSIMQGNTNYLIMKDCILDKNFATYGLIFMYDPDFTIIDLDRVHIFHNTGKHTSGIYICTETTNKTIRWKNSLFYASMNQTETLAMYLYIPNIIDNLDMRFINVTFAKNYARNYGVPTITLKTDYIAILWGYTKNIYLEFTGCVFDGNFYLNPFFSAYGIEQFLKFNITDCFFINNNITFFIISDHTDVGVFRTKFFNNTWNLGHIMYSTATESNFSDIVFIANKFLNYEIFLFSDYSNAVFQNLIFDEIYTNSNLFMLINMNSTTIINLSINDLICVNLMLFVNSTVETLANVTIMNSYLINNIITIKTSVVSNIDGLFLKNNDFMDLFYVLDQAVVIGRNIYGVTAENISLTNILLEIENSQFLFESFYWNLNFIPLLSSEFQIQSSQISLNNSIFTGFSSKKLGNFFVSSFKSELSLSSVIMRNFTQWIYVDSSTSYLFNCTFFYTNNMIIHDSLFVFTNNIKLNISFCNFSKMTSLSSPILIQNIFSSEVITIYACKFLNLNASDNNGGSIYVNNAVISITKSIFSRNSALQGGAIYLFCSFELVYTCNFSLISNIFIRNYASIDGGALKWKFARPIEVNNIYSKNNASYSLDFSGYFCKIGFEYYTYSDNVHNASLLFTSFSVNSSNKLIISNISSNNQMKSIFKLYPLDSYNQIVYEEISNRMDVSLLDSPFNLTDNNICIQKSPKVLGKTSQFIDTNIQSFIFDYIIIVSCPNQTFYLNFSTNLLNMPINLYEMKNSENEIIAGTYSLIFPIEIRQCEPGEIFNQITNECEECMENYYSFSIDDTECSLCPSNAYCPGGNIIILNSNYWRSNEISADIYRCNENIGNCLGGFDSLCLNDYQGILCNNCIGNLKKNFIAECRQCPSDFINVLANFFFFIFIIFVFSKVLHYFEREDLELSKKILGVQFIHYIHLLFLSQKYNNNALRSSMELFITFSSSMWFSLDCFLLMLTNNNDFYLNNFFKTLYLYFGISVYFLIYGIEKRKVSNKNWLKPLFLFHYCTYPFFLSFFLTNLLCKSIAGFNVLIEQTSISCSDGYYIGWAFFFFLPNIIIFTIIIPLIYIKKNFYSEISTLLKFVGTKEKQKFGLVIKIFAFIFQKVTVEESLRFFLKILLIIARYSGLQDEDNDLVNFLILLIFFLAAIKLEKKKFSVFQYFPQFILLIFLLNCYFFVVLDYFYEYSLAIFFVIISVLLKFYFYFIVASKFLVKNRLIMMIYPKEVILKAHALNKKEIKYQIK